LFDGVHIGVLASFYFALHGATMMWLDGRRNAVMSISESLPGVQLIVLHMVENNIACEAVGFTESLVNLLFMRL
jgi:hypothetical protein